VSAENRCKHGLQTGTCSRCASREPYQASQPRRPTSGSGGITEVYRGFTIFYSPPPEREWSFRPEPGGKVESYKSAFQARRAINELLDGHSEPTPRRDTRMTSQPTSGHVDGSGWSDDELRASIEAYARMLRAEKQGSPLTKRDVVNELMKVTGRTKGSIEMRLQNISAVLDHHGVTWIEGYKPLSHYPDRLATLIETKYSELLSGHSL
jgi:hypothetical protein